MSWQDILIKGRGDDIYDASIKIPWMIGLNGWDAIDEMARRRDKIEDGPYRQFAYFVRELENIVYETLLDKTQDINRKPDIDTFQMVYLMEEAISEFGDELKDWNNIYGTLRLSERTKREFEDKPWFREEPEHTFWDWFRNKIKLVETWPKAME